MHSYMQQGAASQIKSFHMLNVEVGTCLYLGVIIRKCFELFLNDVYALLVPLALSEITNSGFTSTIVCTILITPL